MHVVYSLIREFNVLITVILTSKSAHSKLCVLSEFCSFQTVVFIMTCSFWLKAGHDLSSNNNEIINLLARYFVLMGQGTGLSFMFDVAVSSRGFDVL